MPIQTGGISFPFSFQPYLIKYGPGPTIRHLEKNDAATVPNQIQSGGIGDVNFVLQCAPGLLDMNKTHPEILSSCPGWTEENTWAGPPLPIRYQPCRFYPRVRIYVWKKDYYQAEIQSVSGLIENAPNQEKKLVDECDRLKQALTVRETLLSAIQEEENRLAQVQTEQEAILEKIIFLEQQLATNREALAGIEQQHQTDYGKYERIGIPLIFADCGGTLDPGGPERELTIVTSLRTTLEQAENAIVLLCFDTRLLEPMRGQCFSEALGSVLKGIRTRGTEPCPQIAKSHARPRCSATCLFFFEELWFFVLSPFYRSYPRF